MDKHAVYQEYAKRVELFRGLKPGEAGAILEQGTITSYEKGAVIFRHGQLEANLFIVVEGHVGIYINNVRIVTCSVGDGFGATAALDHRPHAGSAIAETNCKCFELDEDHLNRVLEQKTAAHFLLNVIHTLSNQLEEINERNATIRKELDALRPTPDAAEDDDELN